MVIHKDTVVIQGQFEDFILEKKNNYPMKLTCQVVSLPRLVSDCVQSDTCVPWNVQNKIIDFGFL